MYAYVVSAAYQNLPHLVTPSLMVSNVELFATEEGWREIDRLAADRVCRPEHSPENLPYVLHYCQRYWVGEYFFGKRRLPEDFFSCESPLLAEPPLDVATKYDYGILPAGVKEPLDEKDAKRQAFMLCQLLRYLNEAAIYFKKRVCSPAMANLNRSLFLNQVEHFHSDT